MNKITIIGLGPGPRKLMTLEASMLLESIEKIHFRTIEHPVAKDCIDSGTNYESYDYLYEKYDDFDELYKAIAEKLLKAAEIEDVFYAVPGHPNLYDDSVKFIYEMADNSVEIKKIHGSSVHEVALSAINTSITDDLVITNALEVKKHRIDYNKNNLIIGVFNQMIASDLKINLLNHYELDHKIYYIHGAQTIDEKVNFINLEDLDRMSDYNHLTCIYIPKLLKRKNFTDLLEIMDFLRSEDGCPWDRKQTNESIIPYTIEEVYELVETIQEKNYDAFEEELGDLLLQVIFYAQINSEEGYFTIYDVINQIVEKLIRRHPNIFNTEDEKVEKTHEHWDTLKKQEYDEEFIYQGMQRIPKDLPSLMTAYKIQKKAANSGFDWENVEGAYEKLNEELLELKEAYKKGNKDQVCMELGDLLFTVVNISRFLDVRPELALKKSNDKFIKRFKCMEELSAEKNVIFSELNIDSMEKLWNISKK